MNKEIIRVCKEFNIIYMEIINNIDIERRVYGNFEKLPYKGLYFNLLGDETKIHNLMEMFKEDSEPQTWRQGNMVALSYKKQEKLICMFYVTEKKGLESFKYSQSIFERCKEIVI